MARAISEPKKVTPITHPKMSRKVRVMRAFILEREEGRGLATPTRLISR